jgi:hypothetical protein
MTTGRINQVSIVERSHPCRCEIGRPFTGDQTLARGQAGLSHPPPRAANALSLLPSGPQRRPQTRGRVKFALDHKYPNDGTFRTIGSPPPRRRARAVATLGLATETAKPTLPQLKEERLPVVALGLHPHSVASNSAAAAGTPSSRGRRWAATNKGDAAPAGLRDLAVAALYTHGVPVLTLHHFLHRRTSRRVSRKCCYL